MERWIALSLLLVLLAIWIEYNRRAVERIRARKRAENAASEKARKAAA